MKNKIIAIVLAVCSIFSVMSVVSSADSQTTALYEEFMQYKTVENNIVDKFGMDVTITTYADSGVTSNGALLLYVINHMGEYPGTESDEDIISDYLSQGYTISVLDYKNNPLSVSPVIEQSVQKIRLDMIQKKSYIGNAKISVTYVLPAGYRIVRDVVYFEMAKHGSQEALSYFVRVWNGEYDHSDLTKKYATKNKVNEYFTQNNLPYEWVEAASVYDILMKDGSKMDDEDMQLKLDIIYPSKPAKKTPVAALAASGTPRNGSAISTEHPERYQSTGFLFRGYTYVCYDHEYIPYMNSQVGGWGHIEPQYTHQGYDGVKTHTAAIRCIKYYADVYGYSSEKIGVYGHSKSSWSSLLSNPNSEKLPENNTSGLCAPISEIPWLNDINGNPINADITCCYHSMGNGSSRYKTYLTNQNVPTIICCGQKDSGSGCSYWEKEKLAYIRSGIEFLAIPMEDQGHTYPFGDDSVYDYNRYDAFCKFFDYHLKGIAPELLYTSVKDGQLKDLKTTTAKYNKEVNENRWEIIEGDTLFVQFTAPVTEKSFLEAVAVYDSSNNEISGGWYSEGNGNKWIFTGKLVEGKSYTLTVADGVAKDKNGKFVAEGITVSFTK